MNQLPTVITSDVSDHYTSINIVPHKLECGSLINPLFDGSFVMFAKSINHLQELLVADGDSKVI